MDEMEGVQLRREVQCALILAERLQPFVEGREARMYQQRYCHVTFRSLNLHVDPSPRVLLASGGIPAIDAERVHRNVQGHLR